MKKVLVGLLVMLFFYAPAVFSLTIDDATADGKSATEIATFITPNSAWETELGFVNTTWGVTDPFFYVGKDEAGEQVGDWLLTVTEGSYMVNGINYGYKYTVTAPTGWVGSVVDFVLGVKQPTDPPAGIDFVAYYFEAVQLNFDGTFNSYNRNGALEYSHISGFVRDTQQVPEPTTLLLFGAGIAGLAMYRRKRS